MKKKVNKELTELQKKMLECDHFYEENEIAFYGDKHDGNAQIDVFLNEDGLKINLYDAENMLLLMEINLNGKQTLQALSRLSRTYCNLKTYNLDKIGKKLRIGTLYVKLDTNLFRDKIAAHKAVRKHCPEGWEADMYLNSHGSFFTDTNGISWAKTTIRRYE